MRQKQIRKFIAQVIENLPGGMEHDMAQAWIDRPEELRKFLHGLTAFPEVALDFIIRVDRSVKPTYPHWVKSVIHPKLECSGPAEYNLETQVEEWLHDDQKERRNGVIVGSIIFRRLMETNDLALCLNLQDGFAIQQKGIEVFHKLFAGKRVFLWGSVVKGNSDNCQFVPYLYGYDKKVVMTWRRLLRDWNSNNPALRFSK